MSPQPSEHVWWLAGRASGLVAIFLISASVLIGLALASGLIRRPGLPRVLTDVHEHLALATLFAIGIHGATLLGDPWLRPGLDGITLPFAIDYRPGFVAAGIAGGYLAAALGLSYYARRRLGANRWRNAHRYIVVAWALSLVHTLGAGTDAALPVVRWAVLAPVPIAALLLAVRVLPRRAGATPGAAGPPTVGTGEQEPHRLPVADVTRLTDDSVLITFAVPDELRERFRFTAGQHLPVRRDLGGELVRRNYSICSSALGGELRIAVKRIPGGAFSTFANERLGPGEELELFPPVGSFSTELDPLQAKRYVAFAGGSGITPILSIIATALETEPQSSFTLVYGNRTRASTMFRDELEQLAFQYPDRLEILHVLSRENARSGPSLNGRIDRERVEAWLGSKMRPDEVDEWFACGPPGMVEDVHGVLLEAGVDPAHVHLELFFGGVAPTLEQMPCTVTVRLGKGEESFELGTGQSILEGALQLGFDAPHGCMGGACGECKAKVVDGNVAMHQNFALQPADLDAGYVLTCQSHPASAAVTVDYDA